MRLVALSLLLLGLAACSHDAIQQELGKTEQDYVARFGKATKSPMTPDQVAFTAGSGTRLVVRFNSGRSVEELWLVGSQPQAVPKPLLHLSQSIAPGEKPDRSMVFKSETSTPVEVFDRVVGKGMLQVERRSGHLTRLAVCSDSSSCLLLNQVLQSEKATDALMVRGEAQLRREGH